MSSILEKRFNVIFNYTNDCIFICDLDGNIKESNDKCIIHFGKDFKNKNLLDINKNLSENIDYVKSTELVQSFIKNIKTGKRNFPCHFTIIPIHKRNVVSEIIVIVKNIKDIELLREKIENLELTVENLAKENKMYKSIIEEKDVSAAYSKALKKLEIINEKLEAINKNLTKELELASILQKSLVPAIAPPDKRLSFAFHFEPMGHVGGDYYDFLKVKPGNYGVMLADVSGHGVSSAFIAAMFKISFMNYGAGIISPSRVLKKLNEEYCSVIKTGDYVTAFYTIFNLDEKKLRFSGAGHPMPILYHKKKGHVELLPSDGFFIGMFENASYRDSERDFNRGDRYLVYTDGIVEAYSEEKKEQFGEERLKESFESHKAEPLDEMIKSIISDVKKFMKKSKFYDDLTMVAVEYK